MARPKRSGEVGRKLVELFKNDIDINIVDAAAIAHCTRKYAGDVKRWVREGCKGEFGWRHHNPEFSVRKKQGVPRELILMKCNGYHDPPIYFMSESKFIRSCPACSGQNANVSGSGFHDHAII